MSVDSRPLVRQVWQAVNAAETEICGEAAVDSCSVAEGLAVAGSRAACRIEPEAPPPSAGLPVPWVAHHVHDDQVGGAAPALAVHSFALSAANPQQAVDHCLVAHQLAARLQQPGVCTVDPVLARTIAAVELPQPEWVGQLPDLDRSRAEPGLDVEEQVRAAFAEVSLATGRPIGPLMPVETKGLRYAVLATGSQAGLAARVASAIRGTGLECGPVTLALLRPFPAERIREQLAGLEAVAILASGADDTLAQLIEAALARTAVRTTLLTATAAPFPELCQELGQAWGVAVDPVEDDAEAAPAAVVLGGAPARTEVEELLLDALGWLGRPGSPGIKIASGGSDGMVTLSVGGDHDAEAALDLLFAVAPEALAGVRPLERLRECGTLAVRAPSGDPGAVWAALNPDQRATMIRRRQRLLLIARVADHPLGLQAAVLAGSPGIGPAIGRGADLLADLRTSSDEGSTALIRLLAASETLITADPAQLGDPEEPAAAEPAPPPRLPERPAVIDAQTWREHLRQFHFSGGERNGTTGAGLLAVLEPAVLEPARLTPADAPTLDPPTLLEAWTGSVLAQRRKQRQAWFEEVRTLTDRLRKILGRPGAIPGDTAPGEMTGKLGLVGSEFLDAGALTEKLSRRGKDVDIPTDRQARVSQALEVLEELLRHSGEPLAYALGRPGTETTPLPDGVQDVRHPDGMRAAVGLFDGLARETIERVRATRIARLEAAGRYDESVHGPPLARLDWRSLTAEESRWIPLVLVLETARHLRGPAFSAFSELIRGGRPIQLLVSEDVAGLLQEALAGQHPGLGYIAASHRVALVAQTSTGHPEHLHETLDRVTSCLDPVVIIASTAPTTWPGNPRRELQAALHARLSPCFLYDPSGGVTWAERFSLDGNPQPERRWPTFEFGDLEPQAFTLAHAAALDPGCRSHFRVIGPEAWIDEQVPIDVYLDLPDRERSRSLPYLWVVEEGELRRAVISWQMAFACGDRGRAWSILQELAGTDNAYARRAGEEARRVATEEADAKIARLEADFALALEVARGEGATQAVGRLVQLLTGTQGIAGIVAAAATTPALAPAGAAAIPPSIAPAAQPAVAPATAPAPASAPAAAGPYIDSFLCTTCNECIDLNPRMFRYNGDKQAEIGDPAAGSFKQLVKAAEACPARCIHPGQPRAGDTSASPALIERAAKFA